MGKTIVGVVVGYFVMAVFITVAFMVAFPAIGIDRAFQPGTFEASLGWIGLSFVLGLVGAMAGGFACALISPDKAPKLLAALVLVLGIVYAVPVLMDRGDRGGVRGPDASIMEAIQQAKQPGWVALLNPLVGVAGVMIGAGFRTKNRP